jgi:homoserine dehydrogenase
MISISLLGLGTVGKGVYEELKDNKDFKINHILVRSIDKYKGIPNVTNNILDIVNDNSDVLIEVIGGKNTSLALIEEYLKKGKTVISANKALLSEKLVYLDNLAKANNAHLYFEASCCGALPIINYISKSNSFDTFYSIKGILNGSTNYLLTRVSNGEALNDAILDAKEKGFLEANPYEDLDGIDAMNKLIILSKLAYKADFDEECCDIFPLSKLSSKIIEEVGNKKIKYIAESFVLFNSIYLSVEPCLVSRDNILYNVDNETNGIIFKQKLSQDQFFKGYGAGMNPTTSAVLFDLSRFANKDFNNFSFNNKLTKFSLDQIEATYLIDSDSDISSENIHKLHNGLYEATISRQELKDLLGSINSYVRLI